MAELLTMVCDTSSLTRVIWTVSVKACYSPNRMKGKNGKLRMNKMNAGKGLFLAQIQTVAAKIDPETEHSIKTKQDTGTNPTQVRPVDSSHPQTREGRRTLYVDRI